MSDCRSVFLSNVETALITRFGPDEIETISNTTLQYVYTSDESVHNSYQKYIS